MAIKDLLTALRSQARLLLSLAVLGLLIAGVVALVTDRTYSAESQVFVASEDVPNSVDSYANVLGTQSRLPSYIDLVSKRFVLQSAIDRLGLDLGWEELRDQVEVSNPTGTTLLTIAVEDTSAERARDLTNVIAEDFSTYVVGLETPGQASSPVKVTVVQTADVPDDPVAPDVPLILAIGLVLGLAVGTSIAVARAALDSSTTSGPELRERFGLTPLATIPFDEDAPAHPLVVGDQRSGRRAEALRHLRTSLLFVHLDEHPRSVLVTSAVPGEGKTTTACNLAVVLAQAGVEVILVAADLRRPQLEVDMGMEGAVGLTDVLIGQADLDEALQEWGGVSEALRVLPSGPLPPNPSELLGSDQMKELLAELEGMCDTVVIDSAPLLPVADSVALASLVSGTVLVVRAGSTRREHVREAVALLEGVKARVYGAALTMARRESAPGYGEPASRPTSAQRPPGAASGSSTRVRSRPPRDRSRARRAPRTPRTSRAARVAAPAEPAEPARRPRTRRQDPPGRPAV